MCIRARKREKEQEREREREKEQERERERERFRDCIDELGLGFRVRVQKKKKINFFLIFSLLRTCCACTGHAYMSRLYCIYTYSYIFIYITYAYIYISLTCILDLLFVDFFASAWGNGILGSSSLLILPLAHSLAHSHSFPASYYTLTTRFSLHSLTHSLSHLSLTTLPIFHSLADELTHPFTHQPATISLTHPSRHHHHPQKR